MLARAQFFLKVNCKPSSCSLEVEGLVGGEESHELRHNLNTDSTVLVDIEVSPGSLEVVLEIFGTGGTLETLVGSENLSGGSSGGGLGHGELTVWLALTGVLIAVLTFIGVVHDHGLHEEIIRSSGEVFWDNSLVFLVEGTGTNVLDLVEAAGSEHKEGIFLVR